MSDTEYWSAELVDRAGNLIAPLPRLVGGSLEWSIFASVRGGGQIELSASPEVTPDWVRHRIRINHHVGDSVSPVGVYRPMWPTARIEHGLRKHVLRLEDATSRLRSQVGYWVHLPAGLNVVDHLSLVLSQLGEPAVALTPSSETIRLPLAWGPEVTWGEVFGRALGAIGHESIFVDNSGVWRARPYIAPGERPIVATYGAGAHRVRPSYIDEAELGDVPNRIMAHTRATDSMPALVADVRITDEANPFHQHHIGPFTRTIELEATSQAALEAQARRLLMEGLEISRYISWTHPVDDVQLGDRVRIDALGVEVIVTHRRMTLGVGAVVESRGRHIYAGGSLPWT